MNTPTAPAHNGNVPAPQRLVDGVHRRHPSLPSRCTKSVTTSTAARNSVSDVWSASTETASAPDNSVLPRTSTRVLAASASCSDAFDRRGRDLNRAAVDSRAALRTTRSATIISRTSHKSSVTSAVKARTAHSRVAPRRWPDSP
ncbi:hypothetical protein [Pseudarthrobacter sulfonivorans]|uniref:hypothetical protein n=1 Tax=Pseudarthrobacter sulfonivorans TaxID=121292 RepID=UPI001F0B0BD2|nr:hypothetical protein [Pseudarthrobacter sulfonivorans]